MLIARAAKKPKIAVIKTFTLQYASYTSVIWHKPTVLAIQKTFLIKKKKNMELKLVQIIKRLNYIQVMLIFTCLIHFTKRFKSVNKSNE